MTLGTPWMLLALPLVALAAWLTLRARRLQRDAACRLKGVVPDDAPLRLRRGDWLALAALGCVILALARPQWNPRPYDVERRARDLVIALDVSRSMLAADVPPSRLEAARIAVLEALPALAGQRIALITFAGSAAVRVPLTLDHGFVRYMLDRADPSDMDLGSTSLQAAFTKAVDAVLTDTTRGRRDLVVFTDGEDHLSDLDKTAALLAKCGARVLIIGLGDPLQGARVPDASDSSKSMRYKNAEVVSRLDENTLAKLAAKCPNVTYYPARTRPFNLLTLYEKLVADAQGDIVVGELRQVRYTEGYPYLLGLAAALCLATVPWNKSAVGGLLLLAALLLPGCARKTDDGVEAAFQARLRQGAELLKHAEEQSGVDLLSARSLAASGREALLKAALLRPGDRATARQITEATRRVHAFDAAIAKQRAEEQRRHESLGELIQQLEKLTVRQVRLSQQSVRVLARRRQPAKPELIGGTDRDNEMDDDRGAAGGNDVRLAASAATEQRTVRDGTAHVLDAVKFQQQALHEILKKAYGNVSKLPPTELDPIAGLLAEAVAAQDGVLAALTSRVARWPQANTALHTAAGRMEQALEALRAQQPPVKDKDPSAQPPQNDSDYDEDMDGPNTEGDGKKPQTAPASDFQSALMLRALPTPNYTPAEIMAEEAANQQRRAKQKAARAAAKVEKNW